jgi:hypothetical protein
LELAIQLAHQQVLEHIPQVVDRAQRLKQAPANGVNKVTSKSVIAKEVISAQVVLRRNVQKEITAQVVRTQNKPLVEDTYMMKKDFGTKSRAPLVIHVQQEEQAHLLNHSRILGQTRR